MKIKIKDIELTVAETRELYAELQELFGRVYTPEPEQPSDVPVYTPPSDGTAKPIELYPYIVTCYTSDSYSDPIVNKSSRDLFYELFRTFSA